MPPKKKPKPSKTAYQCFQNKFYEAEKAEVINRLPPNSTTDDIRKETQKSLREIWGSLDDEQQGEYYAEAGLEPPTGLYEKRASASSSEAAKPYSELNQRSFTRRKRDADLCDAISKAAGGSADAVDRVEAVFGALTTEEKAILLKKLEQTMPQESQEPWSNLGRRLSGFLVAATTRKFPFPSLVLSHAFRSLGWHCRRKIRDFFNIVLTKTTWGASSDLTGPPSFEQHPVNNGRLGYRKMSKDLVRSALVENSVETSKFLRGNNPAGSGEFDLRRTLTDSSRQVFFESDAPNQVAISTWYRYVCKDHKDIRKGTSKLDVCEDCLAWDRSICGMVQDSVSKLKAELQQIWPTYWDKWEDDRQPLTLQQVQRLILYIDQHKGWDRRVELLSGSVRDALHRAEAKANKELRIDWSRVDSRAGMEQVVKYYSWHFSTRDNQRRAFKLDTLKPAAGTRYVLMDFAQSLTMPLGPQEGSRWWFATARFSVSVLGFFCMGCKLSASGEIYFVSIQGHGPYAVVRASLHAGLIPASWIRWGIN